MELIGQKAFYRHHSQRELKSSAIVSFKNLKDLKDKQFILLKLENGDEQWAHDCYFESFTDSASS